MTPFRLKYGFGYGRGAGKPLGNQLLLNQVSGAAAAAYSVRRLNSSYLGDAIRVRRSSDNAEQDIGFSGQDLDTTSLLSFVGAGDAFVTKWYDQSGNSNDATQSTAASQPQIVNDGSVITENGNATLDFDGTDDFLVITDTEHGLTNNLTIVSVFATSIGGEVISHYNTTLNQRSWRFSIDSNRDVVTAFSNDGVSFQIFRFGTNLNTQSLSFTFFDTNNISFGLRIKNWINSQRQSSNLIQNDVTGNFHNSSANIGIGAVNVDTSPNVFYNGTMQEIILFPSDETTNRTSIENNINNYFGVY